MFGLGGPELIFILLLALLIFGPKKLPQIGRTLGKGMAEFRKASTDLQRAINTEIDDVDRPIREAAGGASAGTWKPGADSRASAEAESSPVAPDGEQAASEPTPELSTPAESVARASGSEPEDEPASLATVLEASGRGEDDEPAPSTS